MRTRTPWIVAILFLFVVPPLAAETSTDQCVQDCHNAASNPLDEAKVPEAQCKANCIATYSQETGLNLATPSNDLGAAALESSAGVSGAKIIARMSQPSPLGPPLSVAEMCARDCLATARSAATINDCATDCLNVMQPDLDAEHSTNLPSAPPHNSVPAFTMVTQAKVAATPIQHGEKGDLQKAQQEAEAAWREFNLLEGEWNN